MLNAIERQRQALELRKAGIPYHTIAQQLGYRSPSGAYKAILSALKRTLQEPADEVRKLELTRLDAMLFALWQQVRSGNQGAIGRALDIEKRRAALLGLDAPVKVAPTTPDGSKPYEGLTNDELTRRLRAVLGGSVTAEAESGITLLEHASDLPQDLPR